MVYQHKKIDYERELNSEQLNVVREGDGPCLVLAGAGSGKTRTIVYRVAYLLERGVPAEQILLLTFTNKAATEMLGRVEMLLGNAVRGLWGGTFHSVAHRILRIYAERAGYRPEFSILDEDDARSLLKTCVKELGIDTQSRRFPSAAVLGSILSFTRNAKLSLNDVLEARYFNFLPIEDQLSSIFAEYAKKKQRANVMDFDDLLTVFLNLIKTDSQVHERLARQFRYILVDEFQDTNPVQAELVERLAAGHRNLLVVGDDAQSIYSFRAADLANILRFPERFTDARVFKLETNYRSTPDILDLANEIIAQNTAQFPKTLQPVQPKCERPRLITAASPIEEAKAIAKLVLELRDDGVKLEDMAVLFRATHLSQTLEMELTKRDIPYEYRGGMKFFERAHIKDVLAFLRVRANPEDSLAWMRVLALGLGIGDATALRLSEFLMHAKNLEEALALDTSAVLPSRATSGWGEIRRILERLTSEASPAELIEAVAKSREYQSHLESLYPNWQDRVDDLLQLATFAGQHKNTAQFLGTVSLYDNYGGMRAGAASQDDERLVLSTIHQAKGLEWEAVILMEMAASNFPNRRAVLSEGGLEEERRLFYVAATRAKRLLYLSYPVTRGYDSLAIEQPSPFIQELDPRLFEHVEVEEKFGESTAEHQYLRDIDEL